MKLRAVLWDWDNTLFDSWETIHYGWCAVSTHFGLPEQSLSEIKAFAHRSCRDIFPELFGKDSDTATQIFYEAVSRHQVMKLMPGVADILGMLKEKGITMGVVSNKEGHTLRKEIEQCGLQDYFQVALGSGDVPHDKPAPHGIQQALGAIQHHATETWYVGDTPVDVEAALQAGCLSVVVHAKESCKPREPDHFCHTLGDLQKLFEEKITAPA